MSYQKPATPEEEAELVRRAEKVTRVFGIIHNNGMASQRLTYTVKATEKIIGRRIKDIMHVKFWVGVDGKGGEQLDIDETVAVFELLADQIEQLAGAKYLKHQTTSSRITVRQHDPSQIAKVLGRVKIEEPADRK